MIAVIFSARTGKLDSNYEKTVSRLRELAFKKYGCLDFISAAQGDQEIAISYWESEDAVRRWKSDAEHLLAQKLGREKWYESYVVQVLEIKREYRSGK